MKWLVDVTVGVVGSDAVTSEATFAITVEADDPIDALGAAEDITRDQMTIEADHARPVEG